MSDERTILGVSTGPGGSAAALVVDGRVRAAAQEQAFTRIRHDPSIPLNAIGWCIGQAQLGGNPLTAVVFHAKPWTELIGAVASSVRHGGYGFRSFSDFVRDPPLDALDTRRVVTALLDYIGCRSDRIVYSEQHVSHASSAYFPSPYETAAVLVLDGPDGHVPSSISHGAGAHLTVLMEQHGPDSAALFQTLVARYCGFVDLDERRRFMALASGGRPTYVQSLLDNLIEVASDGSVRVNRDCFSMVGHAYTMAPHVESFLGRPGTTAAGQRVTARDLDLAISVQHIVEQVVLRSATHAHELTGERNLCVAGELTANAMANARLLSDGPFSDVWIQPAVGTPGAAIGAALWCWHELLDGPRPRSRGSDGMSGCLLGPSFDDDEIVAWLSSQEIPFRHFDDFDALCGLVADELHLGMSVGWFQGPMELGDGALGGRVIVADPYVPETIRRVAMAFGDRGVSSSPSTIMLEEDTPALLDSDRRSPHGMLTTAMNPHEVDKGTTDCVRVVTLGDDGAPRLRMLLSTLSEDRERRRLSGWPFNRIGEPIVRSPADAYGCFVSGDIDILVLGPCVIRADDVTRRCGDENVPDLSERDDRDA